MINLELLLHTLDFKKCDQLTNQLTDRTESRYAIASKKIMIYQKSLVVMFGKSIAQTKIKGMTENIHLTVQNIIRSTDYLCMGESKIRGLALK